MAKEVAMLGVIANPCIKPLFDGLSQPFQLFPLWYHGDFRPTCWLVVLDDRLPLRYLCWLRAFNAPIVLAVPAVAAVRSFQRLVPQIKVIVPIEMLNAPQLNDFLEMGQAIGEGSIALL
jgi:hypothetical protein